MIAVLYANLFVPMWVIDPLLSMAEARLYEPVWSQRIMDEACRAIIEVRHTSEPQATGFLKAINKAFPLALTEGWEPFESDAKLPDPNDRHVVAAARQAGANVIVTYNLKDFPASIISKYGIHAESPDTFPGSIFDKHPEKTTDAMRKLVASKHHPPRTMAEEIERLCAFRMSLFSGRLREMVHD